MRYSTVLPVESHYHGVIQDTVATQSHHCFANSATEFRSTVGQLVYEANQQIIQTIRGWYLSAGNQALGLRDNDAEQDQFVIQRFLQHLWHFGAGRRMT